MLAVVFTGPTVESLQRAAAFMHTAHNQVALIVEGTAENMPADVRDLPAAIIRVEKDSGRGRAVKTAARQARRMGMTHIVTLDADRLPAVDQMAVLASAVAANSDSIVIGRQDRLMESAANRASDRSTVRRRLKNFFFRLQTGIHLKDAQSRLRSYPLVVLEQLRLHANRDAFDTEVLTKAAWAGVKIKEVGIRLSGRSTPRSASFWRSLRNGLGVLVMIVHLTMRSITPLPHRKIVSSGDRTGETISVFRPLRSIRTLLTENVTPVQLAAAGAMGVFLGALPLIALHTVVILFVSSYFRLNKVATLAASQLCMPPIVPALCIEVGYFIRHGEFLTEISFETLGYQALERLWEWLLGSMVVAPVMAALVGGLVYVAASLINRGMRVGRPR
ncbi:MAG: hypothetical protein AMJ54_16855 [Deltaproteobacteria bacterium SG8_13]|nr:MAG: hypothetical protein AMJ54_16855 [Deltaproteobacteria bacterium SG8_13]